MSYTRYHDNMFGSSLWMDDSYEGVCTLKLFQGILFEVRTRQGRINRLTVAKAVHIGFIPASLAPVCISRLTSPDPDDSSGVADGRRLVPDPDGGPNDFIVTNWDAYGKRFETAAKTARQRRWREKKKANASTSSTDRLHVDALETQEEKKRRIAGAAGGVPAKDPDVDNLIAMVTQKGRRS